MESYPSEASRAELSEKLGLSDRQLQMWFCHRRLKDKKEGQTKESGSKKPRNAVAEGAEDEARSEHGSHSGSGSRSGSSPLGYGQLAQALPGNMGPMGRRSYEPPESIFELRVIASVEAQLGEPLREDGPILGLEFDPLPPDAFGAPIGISNALISFIVDFVAFMLIILVWCISSTSFCQILHMFLSF